MSNPESPLMRSKEVDINNQSRTKNGRNLEMVERMEARKESVEQRIDDLLKSLSESLGRDLTLDDLPGEFGDLGEKVLNCFQSVMSCNTEGETFSVLGRFVEATKALENSVKEVQ